MGQIKAAIFDVDHTLYDYQEQKIHESTVAAIQRLKERGILVIVATSRSYAELSEDLLSRICADYYVGASGMSIQDALGNLLHAQKFTYDQAELVKDLAVEYGAGLKLKYAGYNCLYSDPLEMQAIYDNIGHARSPSEYCAQMNRHEKELPIGFTIHGAREVCDIIHDELSQHPGEYRFERFGDGTVAEIFSPVVNKMTALKDLIGHLGLVAANCISFGDGRNDVEMTKWAGIGVAMGNACQEMKEAADVVCGPSWSDGIANQLMALGLS